MFRNSAMLEQEIRSIQVVQILKLNCKDARDSQTLRRKPRYTSTRLEKQKNVNSFRPLSEEDTTRLM